MSSFRPLIAIYGTTGVGKSKLAIELARALSQYPRGQAPWQSAKVINADSMQVYAGLDVLTNKVPLHEREGVEHLLMDFKRPGEQYIVGQWVQAAMDLIDDMHKRREIPIVVGGTSYWIQHLLFPGRLAGEEVSSSPPAVRMSLEVQQALDTLPPHLLDLWNYLPQEATLVYSAGAGLHMHNLLTALDPVVAARWHWKDTRKVIRCLNIIKDTGKRPSDIFDEQSKVVPKPRYDSLCFWLYSDPEVLKPRLDSRVDAMLEQGLLDEVRALIDISNDNAGKPQPEDVDFTQGIYQSIGYREFYAYLTNPHATSEDFAKAVDDMKTSTRQYAKRQVQWIRNQLRPVVEGSDQSEHKAQLYLLDATDLHRWDEEVRSKGLEVTDDFLENRPMRDPVSLSETARSVLSKGRKALSPTAVLEARRKRTCTVCSIDTDKPVMIDESEWDVHVRTRSHKRLIGREDRLKKIAYYKGLKAAAKAEKEGEGEGEAGKVESEAGKAEEKTGAAEVKSGEADSEGEVGKDEVDA
ncbi:tRNA isopentenyltransferase [Schizophyllum commune H4-8]|uniref:tRNA isopentenyltransferase n=1 Tax=Schizophyllum commune (strain H4-8 / FGSC 9210) TaxID=578458 RepID=UPI00215F09BC|nr:tRNA isopentenyltransferase [Schizophyllum commune H4-8]KAI5900077.1 tRNA isopentenyltransferase [Schizophyllum commune H4-8]